MLTNATYNKSLASYARAYCAIFPWRAGPQYKTAIQMCSGAPIPGGAGRVQFIRHRQLSRGPEAQAQAMLPAYKHCKLPTVFFLLRGPKLLPREFVRYHVRISFIRLSLHAWWPDCFAQKSATIIKAKENIFTFFSESSAALNQDFFIWFTVIRFNGVIDELSPRQLIYHSVGKATFSDCFLLLNRDSVLKNYLEW